MRDHFLHIFHYRAITVLCAFICTLVLFSPPTVSTGSTSNPLLDITQSQPVADDNCPICQLKVRWWEREDQLTLGHVADPTVADHGVRAAYDQSEIGYWMRVTYQVATVTPTGDSQIYYHDFTGDGYIIPLTAQGSNTRPRLSPDAQRILFVSNRDKNDNGRGTNVEIYVIQNDGTNESRLTHQSGSDTMPGWAPDGQQIVFTSERDGNVEIYLMNVDGSHPRRLTNSPLIDIYPAWSPDGKTIAWVQANGEVGNLMLMATDGSNQRVFLQGLRFLGHPTWSPDSQQLAFDYDGNGDGFNEPYVVALANGTPQLIPTQDLGIDEWWISSWEPNGRSLLTTHLQFNFTQNQYVLDYIQPISICLVTDRSCDDFSPKWSTYGSSPDLRSVDPDPPTVSFKTLSSMRRMTDDIAEIFAVDRGPSGLNGIEMEYRVPSEAAWRWSGAFSRRGDRWFSLFPSDVELPLGPFDYRFRAKDYAGNRTPWTTSGTTFVYMKSASGVVTDNRDIPQTAVAVNFSAAPLCASVTDTQGKYQAYFDKLKQLKIEGVLQRDDGDLDYEHDFYIKPPNNLITYGDFEILSLRGAWTISGTLTPTIQSEIVAGGDYAVRLGGLCNGLCLQNLKGAPVSGGVYSMTADDQGRLHLVAVEEGSDLTYWQRSANGTWSAGELLYSEFGVSKVAGAANRRGEFVAVWQDGRTQNGSVYLRKRDAAGQWGVMLRVGGGPDPQVYLADNGIWHLFYGACYGGDCSRQTLAHHYQLSDGTASPYDFPLIPTDTNYNLDGIGIAVSATGILHFVYTDYENFNYGGTLRHKTFDPRRGVWSTGVEIPTETTTTCGYLFIDRTETLHLLCNGGSYVSYRSQTPGGRWHEPNPLFYSNYVVPVDFSAMMDRNDQIHIVQVLENSGPFQNPLNYFYRTPDGTWFKRQPIYHLDPEPTVPLALPSNAFPEYMLREQPRAAIAAHSSIAKVVTVPADFVNPTVSFMHAIYGATDGGRSRFELTVTTDLTTTTLYRSSTNTDWRLGWADLTPWQGETITITFATHQAAGELYLQAYVDDVTLGAWTTPVVQSITPTAVPAGRATAVTLAGVNMRNGMQLWLGTQAMGSPQVDGTTAQATFMVPAALGPGAYPIYLTATGSANKTYGGTLYVGDQIWLPIIAR
ncbi:MAG: hypothetical protein R2932_03385 [Caldilineaceae bacterium]